jgi:hypothetical protein
MQWEGNLRKLETGSQPNEHGHVAYALRGADVIEGLPAEEMNAWVGERLHIQFEGQIHCRVTGQTIRKAYGEGMSYQAWSEHPAAVESVLRPELSRIHEGIALRDFEWEQKHHNQPHYVYISQTGAFKVGVTRTTNRPFRWHDQGAVAAIAIAETPYRQLAGEMEVSLKEILSDKTNFRKMLANVEPNLPELEDWKEECFDHLGPAYEPFFIDEHPEEFVYPVLNYPAKVSSLTLDKAPSIEGTLKGIKGQYLLFDEGRVLNVRRHSGYRVRINIG